MIELIYNFYTISPCSLCWEVVFIYDYCIYITKFSESTYII